MPHLRDEVLENGFALASTVLDNAGLAALEATIRRIADSEAVRRKGGIYAIRNLLEVSPEVLRLADSPALRRLVDPVLGPDARPVRGTLFDKTPHANWIVPWHQDLTICVQERLEVEGFGPWTLKAGVHHVQPPASILGQMLAVRLHLDDCGADNGALRVLPGAHLLGRLSPAELEVERERRAAVTCQARRGDALLMRPLLPHASSAATQPSHRRVIHIEYASVDLPAGLRWLTDNSGCSAAP